MLTHLSIKNFKRLSHADVELGDTVVLVGPNNAGKTTALQALALWWLGLAAWVQRKGQGSSKAKERTGVTINRRDLLALPVPAASLLWKDLHTRDTRRVDGTQRTQNILIEITVEGLLDATPWRCALEFDYANAEALYCRPVAMPDEAERVLWQRLAKEVKVAYLPPMSGLAPREFKAERGQINVLIGEGQTAQVLRNLCLTVHDGADKAIWPSLVQEIRDLFGVELLPPRYIPDRSEVEMSYRDLGSKVELDLSSAGRGMQQTLLLLTYLHANPGATVLLDEPDAHLEVLRQRQIYNVITRLARTQRCQILAATHSEVVLAEAAGRHTVIAFVGRPHRLNDQGTQLRKALQSIGFDQYLQAEQTGWVLYLEGSTDLAILKTLAVRLNHAAANQALQRPFVHYINSNTPPSAREHFFGLREAKADLLGLALFDRLANPLALQADQAGLTELCWQRREIENYLCTPDTLRAWAASLAGTDVEDLFVAQERVRLTEAMDQAIARTEQALSDLQKPSPWGPDIKATDDFLDALFVLFLRLAELPRELMFKKSYHRLAEFIPLDQIDPEITAKLDAIARIAAIRPMPIV